MRFLLRSWVNPEFLGGIAIGLLLGVRHWQTWAVAGVFTVCMFWKELQRGQSR